MTPHTSFDSKRRSAADAAHLRGPRVSRRAGRVQHREREQGEPGRPARGSVSSACLLAAGGRTEEASEHTCGLSDSPLGRLRQHTSAQFCPLTLCLVRAQPPHLGAPGDRESGVYESSAAPSLVTRSPKGGPDAWGPSRPRHGSSSPSPARSHHAHGNSAQRAAVLASALISSPPAPCLGAPAPHLRPTPCPCRERSPGPCSRGAQGR